jgi:acetyl esterase/lipase
MPGDRRLAALALVTLLAAACSSGGDGGAADEAEAAEAATTTEVPEGAAVVTVDDAYAVPDPLPPGEPGDPIHIEALPAPASEPGASAWRVLYHSRSLEGDDIAVSGFIMRPPGDPPPGGFPVLAFGHGTTGTADECAPSANDPTDHPLVQPLLDAGYVIAATDYEGLGTPGLHPYLVGQSEGRGILDAARAAGGLDDVDAGSDVVVWGHSQGGHAALFAGEIAPAYAPDLAVAGVVAFAPVGDLALIAPVVFRSPNLFGFGFMALGTWPAAYPDLDTSALFGPAAVDRLPLLDEVCAGAVFDSFDGIDLDQLVLSADPLQAPPFSDLLAENTIGVRPYGSIPVLIAHGDGDELIPIGLSENLSAALCAGGASAEFRSYEATHGSVPTVAGLDALAWSADRLAGAPTTTAC